LLRLGFRRERDLNLFQRILDSPGIGAEEEGKDLALAEA
jgi:hypothetical protein